MKKEKVLWLELPEGTVYRRKNATGNNMGISVHLTKSTFKPKSEIKVEVQI